MNTGLNIFKDLNTEKINYIVWKNTNLIDEFLNGKENLDLLIHKDNHKQFHNLLIKNNWIQVKSTSNNFKEIKHYLYFETDKILHIHAYFKLLTGNSVSKNYDLTNYLDYFQNKNFNNKYNIWILNYDIQLLLLKIRIAIKKKSLLGRYLLLREKKYYKEELFNIEKNIKLKNNEINTNFENGILMYDKELLNSVRLYKKINFFKTFFYELIFLLKILIQKLFKLKKFKFDQSEIIFLSGADSSGKSTITYDLYNLFKTHFKTKVFSISKPYPNFLIKLLIKKKYFENKKVLGSNYTDNVINPNISKLLKNVSLAFFRYIYSLNIFYFNKTTNIIILDRYLSENIGDVNGPRSIITQKKTLIKKVLSDIEIFFYKKTKTLNYEYKIITDLEKCIIRNRNRRKIVKKNDDEIIRRFHEYGKSTFKSKKKFEINNNFTKKETLQKILYILTKNINENN